MASRNQVYEEIAPGYYLWWDEYRGWYISGNGKNYKVKVGLNATKSQAKKVAIQGLRSMKVINPSIKKNSWIKVRAVKINRNGSISLRK